MSDLFNPDVASPTYYAVGMPAIDVLRLKLSTDEFTGFCKGNILKYIFRASHKSGRPMDDYLKAREYIQFLIDQ